MKVLENEKTTYLYINGVEVTTPVTITDHVKLLPGRCRFNKTVLESFSGSDISYGAAMMFLPLVTGQLRISHPDPIELVKLAWNSQWDAVLLGALYGCEVSCNFQANTAADALADDSRVEITNYHLRGLTTKPYVLTEDDTNWLSTNFVVARSLLDVPEFRHAVHCLSTFHWHTYPGARLAIIWSGIEGLFKIESEVVFRLSLYISRFLEAEDKTKRKTRFSHVKKLYRHRSSAVHGSQTKGDLAAAVSDSSNLLKELIYECIRNNSIPHTEDLAP